MIAAFAGALAVIAGTQADPAAPVARWSLQVEPARCLLEQRNPKPLSALAIDTTPGSDSYRVAITSDAVKGSASFGPASLTFAPSHKMVAGLASVATFSGNTPVIWMQGLSPSLLDDLAGSTAVTIATKKGVVGTVAVTGTVKAVDALRRCNADQLVDWGADPAQFAPGGTTPTALKPRDDWLSTSDLLKLAGQSKRSAINDDFRLLVAPDGTVGECRAIADVTEAAFEKMACAAVSGKRLFHPAKDASGSAVLGVSTFRVSLMRGPS